MCWREVNLFYARYLKPFVECINTEESAKKQPLITVDSRLEIHLKFSSSSREQLVASQLCVPLAMLCVFLCLHINTNLWNKEVKSVQAAKSSVLYFLFGQHSFAACVFCSFTEAVSRLQTCVGCCVYLQKVASVVAACLPKIKQFLLSALFHIEFVPSYFS